MVFYIAVIIFHNQHESNHISMVFYIAVIIYDLGIISLTYCLINISPDALCYRHMFSLFSFLFFFLKICQNMGQKLGSNIRYGVFGILIHSLYATSPLICVLNLSC